ncbi:MAG: hypothetical protein HDS98_00465 [Bacteroidales bacterium]|nr:hypothetical protein [Bacteroidales bacterium]
MDTVIEALKSFFGEYVVAGAVLAVAVAWFIWWLSSKYHAVTRRMQDIDDLPCKSHEESMARISERLDETGRLLAGIESRMTSVPCKAHSERHDRHEERLNNTDALLHKMEGQLEILVSNSIQKSTGKIRKTAGTAFSAKHSPRVLNDNGISLLHDCGGNDFLEKHMDYFIAKIETLQPKTALDVEDLALAVLQTSVGDDMFIPLKNWVYNAPLREIRNPDGSETRQEITLDDIIFVLSIPIRDKYLSKHPLL